MGIKQVEMRTQKTMLFKVPVKNERDILVLRRRLTELAGEAGMSVIKQTKMMTASSEIARNMLKYSNGGEVIIRRLEKQAGLRLTFEDEGPGIANVELAMRDGYSSSGSMGIGLPGAKRLARDFSIRSIVGRGTAISMAFW